MGLWLYETSDKVNVAMETTLGPTFALTHCYHGNNTHQRRDTSVLQYIGIRWHIY